MKQILIISVVFLCLVFHKQTLAQISAGPTIGVNLSRLDDFAISKQMLRPGMYAGLHGAYQINNYLSFGIEAAWSEKSLTYQNTNTYSAYKKLQSGLQFIYPDLPDLSELLEFITGTTGLTLNDTAFEKRTGLINFKSIEIPITARLHYNKFRLEIGGYGSFLVGAKTSEIFEQDIPLFEVIPPSTFDSLSPFISAFIYSTFPGLKGPSYTESTSTKGMATFDYGLIGGVTYMPDEFLSLSVSYSYGLTQKLSKSLPNDKTHSVIRFTITYNLFGKIIQKPSF